MRGDEPFSHHNPIIFLFLLAFGFFATIFLLVYVVRVLVGRAPARTGRRKTLVAAVGVCWAATSGMYTWGLLHLFLVDSAARAEACDSAVGPQKLTGYEPSFIPLHFGCRTDDGRVVEGLIPSYLNPAVGVLGLCAVLLTGFLIFHSKETSK